LAVHHGRDALRAGWGLAQVPYGDAIGKYLGMALKKFVGDRRYAATCIESLAINDTKTLRKGLTILRSES
jgi:hypothetical protein